jgi:hypothetical protein
LGLVYQINGDARNAIKNLDLKFNPRDSEDFTGLLTVGVLTFRDEKMLVWCLNLNEIDQMLFSRTSTHTLL